MMCETWYDLDSKMENYSISLIKFESNKLIYKQRIVHFYKLLYVLDTENIWFVS